MSRGKPERIVVIGAGGHGRETISLITAIEAVSPGTWDLLGVLADDEPAPDLLGALGTTWLGATSQIEDLEGRFSVGIGDGRIRRRLQSQAQAAGARPATLVHPTASLGTDVEMGPGCYVGALSALTTNIRLGEGAQVNVGCTISHDVIVGDYATLAPGVRIAGGARIDQGATVFTGATILPRLRIGAGAVVGGGAVVTKDVPADTTVVGVPAKPLTKSTDDPAASAER